MKAWASLVFSLLFLSCSQSKIEIPADAKITAKYVVFTPRISSNFFSEASEIKDFTNMSDSDKEFKLEDKIYIKDLKFVLEKGKLTTLIEFNLADDPLYSIDGVDQIPIDKYNIGYKTKIMFSKSKDYIIDGKDSIKIVKVFPKEKLILVGTDTEIRNSLYEYN